MIYGLLRIQNSPNPFEVLDDVFYNKKIRCFDTANCYGRSENIFGEWISSRGINRDDIYIICKGGHHSYNGSTLINRINIYDVIKDLSESFQRLKIKYADSFMFHRDDPTISPKQIYEICYYLIETKMCKKIGASNWSTTRIEEVNCISKEINGTCIICESQVFLNFIKLSRSPYPNIHTINETDYNWYLKNPEHKIQIYSTVCFINELDNNLIHQNNILNDLLKLICNITNETRQTILYVLLSNYTGLNVECIQGSINPNHILEKSRIDKIETIINTQLPYIVKVLPGFLLGRPIGIPNNNIESFLSNGFVGPFPIDNLEYEKIDSIGEWIIGQNFKDYEQMKNHHEYNDDIKKICSNAIITDIITKYIGYECVCYSTEFFLRKDNSTFEYTANWHIDPYIQLDDTYPHFTIQIGFTDNNENNCLSVVAGSHIFDHQNKYNTINKSNTFAPLMDFDESADPSLLHKLINKKGYVYLFSNYLTHGKGMIQNNDANTRLALTLRIISKNSTIKTIKDSHISNDIFPLGLQSDNSGSRLFWGIVQDNYKKLFVGDVAYFVNKTYTWEDSHIKFLADCKMEAFGIGQYMKINEYNVIAAFGGRIHDIKFNYEFTKFMSVRRDDNQVVYGEICI
jgi:predicted oxidoreductase